MGYRQTPTTKIPLQLDPAQFCRVRRWYSGVQCGPVGSSAVWPGAVKSHPFASVWNDLADKTDYSVKYCGDKAGHRGVCMSLRLAYGKILHSHLWFTFPTIRPMAHNTWSPHQKLVPETRVLVVNARNWFKKHELVCRMYMKHEQSSCHKIVVLVFGADNWDFFAVKSNTPVQLYEIKLA